jgi:uncharacterized protein (DUF58 family)
MEPSDAVVRRLRPASVLPFLVWTGLLVMQLISPDRAWSWSVVGFSVMLLIAYVWARSLRDRVTAERRTQGTWVVAGDELVEQFTLVNTGWLPALWARVRDGSAVPGYNVDRVETASARGGRTWTTTGMCQRRGVFRLGPWDLETSDPLGLFKVIQHYPATTTILVYPRASYLPNLELPRGRAPGRATSAERAAEETITVRGVRPYAQGDSLRRVHWPATARHARLMRTIASARPKSRVRSASATAWRANCLFVGSTASSRLRISPSAPRPGALASMAGLSPGT